MMAALIFHICKREDWDAANAAGRYEGSAQDRSDGFIHFSTAEHLEESAARHLSGQEGLVLLAVEAGALGAALKWQAARGGVRFPHLHGALPTSAVRAIWDLPLGPDSRHVFPPLDVR